MTTTAKITITRNHMIHHSCFYDIINLSAWNAGLQGSVHTRNEVDYVFKMSGPFAAIQDFIRFLRFGHGALGNIVSVIEEDAVVPQSTYDRPQRPSPEDIPDTSPSDDAVVPNL